MTASVLRLIGEQALMSPIIVFQQADFCNGVRKKMSQIKLIGWTLCESDFRATSIAIR